MRGLTTFERISASRFPTTQLDTGPEDTGPTWPGDPYTIQVFDAARINSRQSEPNFQSVVGPADLAGGPFAEVKMIVAGSSG